MNMISKLHRKFILAGTLAVILIVVGALALLNATVYIHETSEIEGIITAIADNGGTLPDSRKIQRDADDWSAVNKILNGDDWITSTPDFLYQVRYFSVLWGPQRDVEKVDISHTAAFTIAEAVAYADKTAALSSASGFLNKPRRRPRRSPARGNCRGRQRPQAPRCPACRRRWR